MTQAGSDNSLDVLRKVVTVEAPQDIAWQVFTQKMSTWWPLATHKIGLSKAVDAIIEPQEGGRWYERGEDGSTCDWGRVLAWEPNGRLVLSWQITADWGFDPELHTEVEIRFIPEGTGRTRVELEHRGLGAYRGRMHEMRGIFDSDRGWSGILASFAGSAVRGDRP
jgi:uncharacterized protein YndB with AHSA1/START domain